MTSNTSLSFLMAWICLLPMTACKFSKVDSNLESLNQANSLSSKGQVPIDSIDPNSRFFDPIKDGLLPSGLYKYTPQGIRSTYHITPELGDGAGQTIAVICDGGYPNVQQDLAAFSNQFGLPPANLTVAYPSGNRPWDDAKCNFSQVPRHWCASWAAEINLDVQIVHAIAPAAKILLVVANNTYESESQMSGRRMRMAAVQYAVEHGAKIVSMSFGWGESTALHAEFDKIFEQNTDVTFIGSSGDTAGWLGWPGTSPFVLSIGGTHLEFDPTSSHPIETAWKKTGGGVSPLVPIPEYQRGARGQASLTQRSTPDVGSLADSRTGFWIYSSANGPKYNGDKRPLVNGMPQPVPSDRYNWYVGSGTSAGAPLWAGLVALVNAKRTKPIGSRIHQALYRQNVGGFRDITDGCYEPMAPADLDGNKCAGRGFDLLTGLGVPVADRLVPYLAQSSGQ